MAIFLERVSSAPLNADDLSDELDNWFSTTVDSLNETISEIEKAFNEFAPPSLTQAEIIAIAPTAQDGRFWYCTDHVPPVFVGKQNGALVQFTTTPFP